MIGTWFFQRWICHKFDSKWWIIEFVINSIRGNQYNFGKISSWGNFVALPKHLEMTHILFKIVLHLPKSTSCLLFQFKFFEIVPMYEKKSRQSKLYGLLEIISGSSDMVWTILYQPTTHYRVFVLKKNMLAKRLWALNVCVDLFHRFCYSEIQRKSASLWHILYF